VTELRDRYFRTLELDRSGAAAKPRLEAALARAHKNRDFEIEHYWRRATYFWAFQVAIFAAFGFLWRGSEPILHEWGPIILALAGLGILTAVANALSARGSRFWQENWETHIDMLEDEIEGRLYKTVWLDRGKVSFSVSRVNQYLIYYFIVFWALLALFVAWRYACPPKRENGSLVVYADTFTKAGTDDRGAAVAVFVVGLLVIVGIVLLLGQTTDLSRGTLPKADSFPGEKVRQCWPKLRWPKLRWRKRICGAGCQAPFIRRKAPDE
jgi:hypothetical protein